ncbi:MAG: carboxylating nicotinate-nucleotide diphosphorylase [Chthoniobacterales bacterium]
MTTPHDPIDIALGEDIGEGDLTTQFFVSPELRTRARIVVNESAIIAGTNTAAEVFRRVDPATHVRTIINDGTAVNADDTVIELEGLTRALLSAERVALNFLQRLSGIATLTRKFVEAAANDRVRIIDTRKTTPGMRALEKAAVVAGGGGNHRFGLFDMVLVKDNHLAGVSGSRALGEAIAKVRQERPGVQIEVEADNLKQVRELLKIDGIDRILLDNMKPAQMREAIALGKGKIKFEASGGVTLKNVRQIAAIGVDFISIGALTHSPRAIDFSLELTDVGI